MSQSNFQIDNVSRSLFRTQNNAALQALASLSSGATEPTTTYAYQLWADTTSGNLKIRNSANNAWITIGSLSAAGLGLLPLTGGTLTGDITMSGASIIEAEGADVASAATTNIWATDGNTRHITGNVTITSFGTAPQAGMWMKLIFDGTPLLTQSANLNVNGGGSNVQIEAGDIAWVYADTTTQLDVIVHKKSGQSVVPTTPTFASAAEYQTGTDTTKALNSATARARNIVQGTAVPSTSGTTLDFTGIPSWAKRVTILFDSVSLSGTSALLVQIGDSGGIENTGYSSGGARFSASGVVGQSSTAGFIISMNANTHLVSGAMQLHNISGNLWASSHSMGADESLMARSGGGSKTLSATLDRVRITSVNGTDTLDGGNINIMYE